VNIAAARQQNAVMQHQTMPGAGWRGIFILTTEFMAGRVRVFRRI
jgi:hypothetical protein